MKKIVLAGGSGQLGQLLAQCFAKAGRQVIILSRRYKITSDKNINFVEWDGIHIGPWINSLEGAELLINLCGDSINQRFTAANKKRMHDSRILPTAVLGTAINKTRIPPKAWINLSGISLFAGLNDFQDEHSTTKGKGFLADLSDAWEKAFLASDTPQTNKTILRLSPVLSNDFGLFPELFPLAKRGLGGKVASGKQWVSWIHEQDFLRLVTWIAQLDQPAPVYHATSPNPCSNAELMAALREAAGISFGLPLPRLFAHIGAFFKGVDPSLLLESVPAITTSTLHDGFEFEFSYIRPAINQLAQPK